MNNETTSYIAPALIFRDEIESIEEKLRFKNIIIEVTKDEVLLAYFVMTHPRNLRPNDGVADSCCIIRLASNIGNTLRVFNTKRCHLRFRLVDTATDLHVPVVIFKSISTFLDEFSIREALESDLPLVTWKTFKAFILALDKGQVRRSHPAIRNLYSTKSDLKRLGSLNYDDRYIDLTI